MANVVENEIIKAEMQDGLSQVDENLVIGDFETVFEQETRILRVFFTAINKETGEAVEMNETLN